MKGLVTHAILRYLSLPGILTGPIFGKELRVSSRRRRTYALRFAYVVCLAGFVALVWLNTVRLTGHAVQLKTQMAAAGKQIISTIVVFQFVATQILAVIMLSTAISDEIYHRTLGLLMTTSISSLQIVMGKLLSKLLQLILLIGITLPILAIVRVFGGVPWTYLLSSLCITLSAAIFAGSLSLRFSIGSSRAYGVIIRTAFVLACFYFILPAMFDPVTWGPFGTNLGARSPASWHLMPLVLLHLNPVASLWQNTVNMLSPGRSQPFWWPANCGLVLMASMGLLAWSVKRVRTVALRQACGMSDLTSQVAEAPTRTASHPSSVPAGPIKRVVGPPVTWKELRAPFIRGVDNRNGYIGLAVAVGAQLVTYILAAPRGGLTLSMTHTGYGLLFVGLGLVFGIVFSATCITTEKESQSWLLLLATPLSDREILLGKAASAFRRTVPIWVLLAGHLLLFTLMGYLHPIVWIQLPIIAAWSSFFAICVGLYFSSRCRHTSSAVIAGLALLFGVWVVGPALAGGFEAMFRRTDWPAVLLSLHPLTQIDLVFSGVVNLHNNGWALRDLVYGEERFFFNPYGGTFGWAQMMRIQVISVLVYGSAGLFLLWRAKCHLRKRVF